MRSLQIAIIGLTTSALQLTAFAQTPLYKQKARIAAQAGSMACMVKIGRVSEAESYRLLNQNIKKAGLEAVANWLMTPQGTYAAQVVQRHLNASCTDVIDQDAMTRELAPLVL